MQEAVKLVDIEKTINKKQIINNFSLSINKGEIFGLLGPNGAGKTTLIKLIVGLIHPTSGNIFINDINLHSNFKKAIANVGSLVENPSLYPNLTGYKNLKLFSKMYENSNDNLDSIIEILGMKDFIHKKTNQYSLGMKQRLGIAIALLNNPSILILDEPTNGLDPQGIMNLRNYLKKLTKEKNICIIISSHLLSEMELTCDRFAIINKGNLVDLIDKSSFNTSSNENYSFEVDNLVKALNLIKDNFNCSISDNILKIDCNRNDIPNILKLLIHNDINLYSVFKEHTSLENYYFKSIKGDN